VELSIAKSLHQGVAAHKDGKLQDAERFYRAILKIQPEHPDANHNLGVLAVSFNQTYKALPLFKTALKANPKMLQYWISYVDALIKEQDLENAKRVIQLAKERGIDTDSLKSLEAQIRENEFTTNNGDIDPPQEVLKDLLAHYENGRYNYAEELASSLCKKYPSHPLSWSVLGAVLRKTGRVEQALSPCRKSALLSPDDAAVHYNLGITLKELDRLEEAEGSYRKAIALNPDLAEAHNNLGITLQELGKLEEAQASYTQAIALKPSFVLAHSNLGVTLKELGRLDDAIASYAQAIALKPDYAEAYVNLGIAIKNVRFNSSNRKLYPALTRLLTAGNFTRPRDVAKSILSLLKHDTQITELLLKKESAVTLNEATSIIGTLDKLPLLHHLMRVCPLPELQFEELFVAIRSLLLKNLDKVEVSPELIYFLSTLSIHCFTNEYVYTESDEEIHLIGELQTRISRTVARSMQPEAIQVLCLASYRPLHQYDWCQKIRCIDNLEEVKERLIEEPLLERVIANEIPVLEEISDDVSLKVRNQYEENPYPRWVKTAISIKSLTIAEICDGLGINLQSEDIKEVTSPSILIAGCGTGQHSIGTASRFLNCHVTAIDLSLASLAYAQRKSKKLCLNNVDYLQADILHLHKIEKAFDIIESSGVLHHMDEPMAGWRVLVDLLKPGGLMKIGLYSGLARQDIVEVRKEISDQKLGASEEDIRNFRQSLVESEDANRHILTKSIDFFSLSTMRDLIFHVQEHHFNLPQIKCCLDELGLEFCGFEGEVVISSFKEFYGDEADIYDLGLWHLFEEKNPRVFSGMYQFWCQKPLT
jgi:tetratricopeptide (TPR) repeat protein/SAM-dependent methyltransferase